ncbi:MAG: hypothetical protein CL441_03980 [Acidimicrobiaceae bacterium]|nr:hypothetical protein [Acidimicrobiaceae bacterium]
MARQKMSDAEKAETRAVRDYLKALEANQSTRGRKRTPASVQAQINAANAAMDGASATKRLALVQQRLDLEAELERLQAAGSIDLSALEADFVAHAAAYSGKRGISHAAWREVGVPSPVLKAAGIRRAG